MSKHLLDQLQRAHERRWSRRNQRNRSQRPSVSQCLDWGIPVSHAGHLLQDQARARRMRALTRARRFSAVWGGRGALDCYARHGFTRQPLAHWGELMPMKCPRNPRHVDFRRSRLDEELPF